MACAINFSRHIFMPNYAQRCCKTLQQPHFGNLEALLQGKECVPFVVQVHSRYCSTEDTKHIQLIRAEFENLHKNLKALDNLWDEAMKEGKLHIDKVRGERVSFPASDSLGDRYFSNEMMKVFQSSAEVDNVIEIGQIFTNRLNDWFPRFPMVEHPQRAVILASIKKRIMELEAVLTGNGPLPIPDREGFMRYGVVKKGWLKLLQETDNPRVNRLLALLEDVEIDTYDLQYDFCSAVALFFDEYIEENTEVRPLTEFEPDEIKFSVQPLFDEEYYWEHKWKAHPHGDTAFKFVMHVLMKPLTEFSS